MSQASSTPFKRVKKAFTYNVMVCGASGLGKTTFIRTLLQDSSFISRDEDKPQDISTMKTTQISVFQTEMDYDKRKINFSLIDTPGFGDAIDNSKSTSTVLNYVEEQFRIFLKEESRIQRNAKFLDPRVHVIIYFIKPNGHGLSELDIEFLNQVGNRANIIPVVAKADTLTPEELAKFKQQVMDDITQNGIEIFDFPYSSDLDESLAQENDALESLLPFSIVASEKTFEVNGKRVRGRQYPWGIVEVDNEEHCDFPKLVRVLFETHLEDMKDITQDVHYEAFRKVDLIRRGKRDSSLDPDMNLMYSEYDQPVNPLKSRKSKRERIAAKVNRFAEQE